MDKFKEYLDSPRVIAFIVGVLMVVFKDQLAKVGITEEQLTGIVGLIVSIIVGTSIRAPRSREKPVGP